MVTYDLVFLPHADVRNRVVIKPDLAFNAAHGIISSFSCGICSKGIGISWKQGPKEGMIVLCPHCKSHNLFVRREL